jgi:hypothetical protein
MSEQLINLTFRYVTEVVEAVLEETKQHRERVIFLDPQWRHKLIFHVLDRVPNHYTILRETESLPQDIEWMYSVAERVQMEILIRQSMIDLLPDNREGINRNQSSS